MDIIIATSGRLVDHILKTPGFSLDSLRFLIIDEADRAAEWIQYLPEPHSRAPILTLGNIHSRLIFQYKIILKINLNIIFSGIEAIFFETLKTQYNDYFMHEVLVLIY